MMKNGHDILPFSTANVPILGGPAPKKFRCANGHEWQGAPPSAVFPLNPLQPVQPGQGMQVIMASGVCLQCLVDWMTATFPTPEVVDDGQS